MKIEKMNLQDLEYPEWNPRTMDPDEEEKLKNSIQEFGYVEPIIVNTYNNHIVGGNQRAKALENLGYTMIEVIPVHIPNINEEKALNIALNKINGDWDYQKLTNILNEIQEEYIAITGFDEWEIKELEFTNQIDEDDLISEDDYKSPEPSQPKMMVCPHCGETFEV